MPYQGGSIVLETQRRWAAWVESFHRVFHLGHPLPKLRRQGFFRETRSIGIASRRCFVARRTLLEKSGWPPEFVRKVPLYASIFSSGHSRLVRSPLVLVKRLAFAVVGRLGKGMPTVSGAEAWAFKNTMLAVQVTTCGVRSRAGFLMLGATRLSSTSQAC